MDKSKVKQLKEKISVYKKGVKVASTHTLTIKRRVLEASKVPVCLKKNSDKKVSDFENFIPEENI